MFEQRLARGQEAHPPRRASAAVLVDGRIEEECRSWGRLRAPRDGSG